MVYLFLFLLALSVSELKGLTTPTNSDDTSALLESFSLSEYAVDGYAVCNDGSSGIYYFSSAKDESLKNVYLIYLPGDGQCYDEESCRHRWNTQRNMMSSIGWPVTTYRTGLLDKSKEKNVLWGANKAMLLYCSSDNYMGNAPASNETKGWNFLGQNLVFAMVHKLIKKHKMSSSSTIIFAGGAAVSIIVYLVI